MVTLWDRYGNLSWLLYVPEDCTRQSDKELPFHSTNVTGLPTRNASFPEGSGVHHEAFSIAHVWELCMVLWEFSLELRIHLRLVARGYSKPCLTRTCKQRVQC